MGALTERHVVHDADIGGDLNGVVEDAQPVMNGGLVVLQSPHQHQDEGNKTREDHEPVEVGQAIPGQVDVHTSVQRKETWRALPAFLE